MTLQNNHSNEASEYSPHEILWSDKKIDRLWGYYSGSEIYQKEYFSYQAGKIVLNRIERAVNFKKSSAILDYGCGPGFLLEALLGCTKPGQKCYGLDFSRKSVELVEKKFAGIPNYGGTVWAENLPTRYQDEGMDLVISLEVVEHLDDEKLLSMVKEIHRILKPRGYIVITTPNRENLSKNKAICPECGAIFHRWQHVRTWTVSTLQCYMETCGFKTVQVQESNFASKHQRLVKYFLKIFPQKKTSLLYIGVK